MTHQEGTGGDVQPPSDGPSPEAEVDGQDGSDLFVAVSEWLREAFARVAADQELSPEERRRWQRRLVAITNTTKRDLVRAREQTRHFDRDWEAGPGAPATG